MHSEEEALGTRLTIDSLTCLLANETDPSRLTAVSPGKLMRYLVDDGSYVVKDQPYAEVEVGHSLPCFFAPCMPVVCFEANWRTGLHGWLTLPWFGLQVMKMVMTLLTPANGHVRFQMLEGSLLTPGDLIARLDLENPDAASQVVSFTGGFPELGPPLVQSVKVDQKFKTAFATCKNVLQGEDPDPSHCLSSLACQAMNPAFTTRALTRAFKILQTESLSVCHDAGYEHAVDQVVADLLFCLDNPTLALLQWQEVFSVVEVRQSL